MKNMTRILWGILIALCLLFVTLIVLFLCGFSFDREKPLDYYRDLASPSVELENGTLYFPYLLSLEDPPVFPRQTVAVKQFGPLYYKAKSSQYLNLFDENYTYVGSIERFSMKGVSACVIYWAQRSIATEEGIAQYFPDYTENVEVNGTSVTLEYGFLFRLDGKIESMKLDGREVKLYEEYPDFSAKELAPVPAESKLDFWITDDLTNADLSAFTEIPGWFGATQYYGKGYGPVLDKEGNPKEPEIYVKYLVTAYPDYADGGRFVTRIDITDPEVNVCGINCRSTEEEFRAEFENRGYIVAWDKNHVTLRAKKAGVVEFWLCPGNGNAGAMLVINAPVTNHHNIQY